jgi:hypothetical protein
MKMTFDPEQEGHARFAAAIGKSPTSPMKR